MYTKTLDIERDKLSLLQELKKVAGCSNHVYSVNKKPFFTTRKFSILEKYNTSVNNIVRSVFLSCMIQAEKKSPTISDLFIPLYIDLYSGDKKINFGTISKLLRKFSNIPNRQWIKSYVNANVPDKKIGNMLFDALDFVGLHGKLNIDYTERNKHRLDLNTGCRFSIGFPHDFTRLQQITRSNTRIIVIDGIIEKISQIDHWLRESSQRNESAVIFCLGMLPDVVQTLKLNFKLKKLDVIPVLVSVDNETVNTLKDISIVCNTRYVSIDRGDVLATIQYDEFATINSATLSRSDVIIDNPRNKSNIEKHISELRKKMHENENTTYTFIEQRIKSLSSRIANLYISSSAPVDKLKKLEAIDKILLLLPQVCSYGIITFDDDTLDLLESEFGCKLQTTRSMLYGMDKPYYSFLSALYFACSTIDTIKNTNFAVLQD